MRYVSEVARLTQMNPCSVIYGTDIAVFINSLRKLHAINLAVNIVKFAFPVVAKSSYLSVSFTKSLCN